MLEGSRTIRTIGFVLTVLMIATCFTGCSRGGNDAYLSLFDIINSQWDHLSGSWNADSASLIYVLRNTRWSIDYNYYGFGSFRRDINSWIDQANAIQVEDKSLKESRNYLLLALKSKSLQLDLFEQTVFQKMMTPEKLTDEYLKQRMNEIDAADEASQDAMRQANDLRVYFWRRQDH